MEIQYNHSVLSTYDIQIQGFHSSSLAILPNNVSTNISVLHLNIYNSKLRWKLKRPTSLKVRCSMGKRGKLSVDSRNNP